MCEGDRSRAGIQRARVRPLALSSEPTFYPTTEAAFEAALAGASSREYIELMTDSDLVPPSGEEAAAAPAASERVGLPLRPGDQREALSLALCIVLLLIETAVLFALARDDVTRTDVPRFFAVRIPFWILWFGRLLVAGSTAATFSPPAHLAVRWAARRQDARLSGNKRLAVARFLAWTAAILPFVVVPGAAILGDLRNR